MAPPLRSLALVLTIAFPAIANGGDPPLLTWSELPPLPDPIGFAGSFAGVSNGALIVAGGANFPAKPPWEGGTKVWTDRVFVLEKPDGAWRELPEKLPRPLGYGVSLTINNRLYCIGGSDAERHYTDVFTLEYVNGELVRDELPPLPRPSANACGAVLGDLSHEIYIAGGLESPTATTTLKTFWKLNLLEKATTQRWEELEPWPGTSRMLSVAAVSSGHFTLISGTELTPDSEGKPKRRYLTDAYEFNGDAKWEQIGDVPYALVAAPSPAANLGEMILIFGGDDGSKVHVPQKEHTGFPNRVLERPVRGAWRTSVTMPAPFVTTPLVPWNGGFVIPGGEIRPGVRTNRVLFVKIADAPPFPESSSSPMRLVVPIIAGIIMLLTGLYLYLRTRNAKSP